jgi:hypothetical protein
MSEAIFRSERRGRSIGRTKKKKGGGDEERNKKGRMRRTRTNVERG